MGRARSLRQQAKPEATGSGYIANQGTDAQAEKETIFSSVFRRLAPEEERRDLPGQCRGDILVRVGQDDDREAIVRESLDRSGEAGGRAAMADVPVSLHRIQKPPEAVFSRFAIGQFGRRPHLLLAVGIQEAFAVQ